MDHKAGEGKLNKWLEHIWQTSPPATLYLSIAKSTGPTCPVSTQIALQGIFLEYNKEPPHPPKITNDETFAGLL